MNVDTVGRGSGQVTPLKTERPFRWLAPLGIVIFIVLVVFSLRIMNQSVVVAN